jgi:hypothetical protein
MAAEANTERERERERERDRERQASAQVTSFGCQLAAGGRPPCCKRHRRWCVESPLKAKTAGAQTLPGPAYPLAARRATQLVPKRRQDIVTATHPAASSSALRPSPSSKAAVIESPNSTN